MKELNILSRTEVCLSFYQPRRSIRVASEILKMNLILRYFLSLTMELASNQLHKSSLNRCLGSHSKLKGTLRVLVENNCNRDNVCHMASSETQGLLVGARGNKSGKEMKRLQVNIRRFISLPDLFPLAPTNLPWVSEDGHMAIPQ